MIQNDGKILVAQNPYAASTLLRFLASGAEISVEQPLNTVLADGGTVPFGIVANGANADRVFTIKSLGDVNLTGLGITVDGANAGEFTVTASPTAPVAPGGSTTFTVRFAPVSSGPKSAALHIANNDGNESPFDLQLTGYGLNVGNVDPFFNPNVTGSYVQAIAVLPRQLVNAQLDATMAIGGNFTAVSGQPRTNVAWLYPDGTVSTVHVIPNAGPNADIAGLAVQTNLNTLLGGGFTSVSGQARNRIARLGYFGAVEDTATFNPGTGANDFVYDGMLQPDGRILLGGEFTTLNGSSRNRFARLNTDGTVESTATFDPGTGANGTGASVALQADSKLLLGGAFTSVNGQPRTRLARLHANGAVESTGTFKSRHWA